VSRNVRTPNDPRTLVLVVEDDRPTRDMLRVVLEDEGYLVWDLDDGRNVIGTLLTAVKPCVVLLDLMMPHVSGWDVCQALAQDPRMSQHAVAVMTAGLTKADQMRAPAPARVLIPKPFDLDRLCAQVESLARSLGTAPAVAALA
jgi:CheY-like chemotaxis protein